MYIQVYILVSAMLKAVERKKERVKYLGLVLIETKCIGQSASSVSDENDYTHR